MEKIGVFLYILLSEDNSPAAVYVMVILGGLNA